MHGIPAVITCGIKEVDFMYISKDFSYINANETMLMDKGYGKMSVHSIHFDRHYSEEQKKKTDNSQNL